LSWEEWSGGSGERFKEVTLLRCEEWEEAKEETF